MDVCAKTGTTNDDYDRWLCEFTPYYTAATWYGYDDQETVHYSGNPAGKISSAIFKEIHKNLEGKSFKEPTGIVTATICKDTGLLPAAGCTNTVTDIFIKGTVPTDTCSSGTVIEICKETNKIATEFCPEKESRRFEDCQKKNQNITENYGIQIFLVQLQHQKKLAMFIPHQQILWKIIQQLKHHKQVEYLFQML